MLCPHAHTVPSLFKAIECSFPPAIATTPVSPLTETWVYLSKTVPSPIWPYRLYPQAETVPSDLRASECCPPAATDLGRVVPVRPITWTGVVLFVVVPSPKDPLALSPQVQTVPSLLMVTE